MFSRFFNTTHEHIVSTHDSHMSWNGVDIIENSRYQMDQCNRADVKDELVDFSEIVTQIS